VIEEEPYEIDGVQYPVDTTRPNPNGEEMHNLYLDFNGIVHPCSHPEGKPPPSTESEMMMEIFKYTERVVNMVRPRRLLYIAIDGVAPRAKMNQQRARRFRAARDAKEKDEKDAEFNVLLRRQQESRGELTTMEDVVSKTWDSNVITPGTPFMFILALSIRYWVQYKFNTDPAWANLKVIISDASVPGEGEHKIMNFVRSQRSDPEYDPNTKHVMYGLDADLIMLGLATHEPHFRILREDVSIQDSKPGACNLCGQKGHFAANCRGVAKVKSGNFDEKGSIPDKKPFIWLNVPILREYLGAELFVPGQPFRFDLERALDDWVFMCFFVGNDFLPHLPSLDIHEDGIDKLIAIWRDNIPVMGGYLTCDGSVDLARAQCILQGLAKQEDAIFRRRKEVDDKREANQRRREQQQDQRNGRGGGNGHENKRRRSSPDYSKGRSDGRAPAAPINAISVSEIDVQVDYNSIVNRGSVDKSAVANKSAAAAMKAQLLGKQNGNAQTPENSINGSSNGPPASFGQDTSMSGMGKRKADMLDDSDNGTPGRSTPVEKKPQYNGGNGDELPPDTVRLWEDGYADRYYEQKFHVSPNDIEFRHKVAAAYVEGLCWVLLYYMQGCASWTWYYPYHYAPFAADFKDLDKMKVTFEKGIPFRPYEQLMGVLPAASNHAIPKAFHPLMTDEDSPIVDFYPEDFDLDANGKKQSWKAIVLLPFIDEKRLLSAMGTKYPLLSEEEHERNAVGKEALLVGDSHPLYDEFVTRFYSKKAIKEGVKLSARKGDLAGKAEKNDNFLPHMDLLGPENDIRLEPPIDDDRSMSVHYSMPAATHVHKSMLLRGVELPQKVLDNSDLAILKSKARNSGRDFGGAPLFDNRRQDPMDRPQNGRGGRINYAADRSPQGMPPPPSQGSSNPFAAFLDPGFAPGTMGNRLPPPPPPPPPQYAGQNGYYRGEQRGGYGGQQPAREQYAYNGGGGYPDQHRGGQQGYGGQQQQYGSSQNGGRGGGDGYYQGQNQGRGGQQEGYRGGNQGGYYGGR
jgi:5'-3' exoribonuclease 2